MPVPLLGFAIAGTLVAAGEAEKIVPSAPVQPLTFTGTGAQSSTQRYPKDLSVGSDSDYVRFDFYEYAHPFMGTNLNNPALTTGSSINEYNASSTNYKPDGELGNIILYMPEDISTGHKANWAGKNFSNIGADILRTAGAKNFGEVTQEAIDGIGDAIEKLPAVMSASLINAALGKITGESVSMDELFGSTRGVIMNPNSELLFTGLDMRNFSLSFKLIPRNAPEAKNIENIIRTFKKAMLPLANTKEGPAFSFNIPVFGDTPNASYIKVPSVCKVSFMRGNSLNPDVPQYKHCAITQVDINYTPDGVYATNRDGKMVAYQLTVAFQETKLIYREEIQGSGPSY